MTDPVVIKKHSLTVNHPLTPASMSLSVPADTGASGSMVLGTDEEVHVNDWVLSVSPQGQKVVMTASAIETDCVAGKVTVTLKDAYELLGNVLISIESESTVSRLLTCMLESQTDFVLGECAFDDVLPLSVTNQSIKAGIDTITGALSGWQLQVDYSVYPFVINLMKRPEQATCEIRIGRNAGALRMKVDTSGMYTRMIAEGADELTVRLERNVDEYGLIEHYEQNGEIEKESMLKAWAQARLDAHAEPQVSVSVTGVQLSSVTGEPFDRLLPGTVCRVPLRDFGTCVMGRIDTVSWSDVISAPDAVSVTISNKRADAGTLKGFASMVETAASSMTSVKRSTSKSAAKTNKAIYGFAGDLDSHYSLIRQDESCIEAMVMALSGSSYFKMESDKIIQILRDSKGGIIGGMLTTIDEQGKTINTIYNDLNIFKGALEVGKDSLFKSDLSVHGWLDVSGNFRWNGHVLGTMSGGRMITSMTNGKKSVIEFYAYAPTSSGDNSGDVKKFTVVKDVTFPTIYTTAVDVATWSNGPIA